MAHGEKTADTVKGAGPREAKDDETAAPARGGGGRMLAAVVVVAVLVGATVGAVLFLGPLAPSGSGSYSVTDDRGKVVRFDRPPARIVSIAASATEILCAVGLCSKIVALDNSSDYPPEVVSITNRVYGFKWIDREGMKAARPDVVVGAGINTPDYDVIEKELGMRLVIMEPTDLPGLLATIRMAGEMGGVEPKADQIADSLNARMNAVTTKVAGAPTPTVYYEVSSWGGYWSVGPGSFGHALIGAAGGMNIAGTAATSYPSLSSEEIVAADPDLIAISWSATWGGSDPNEIKSRAGWSNMTAIRQDRLVKVDSDHIDRPGPRLVNGLEEMARTIHPELFK